MVDDVAGVCRYTCSLFVMYRMRLNTSHVLVALNICLEKWNVQEDGGTGMKKPV